MAVDAADLIKYVLGKLGCLHPFTISRLIALAEIRYVELKGERLTSLRYVPGPGTFFIEGLKEIVESDPCFEKREGDPQKGIRGCIMYKCTVPSLPSDVKEIVDDVISKYANLDDMTLNKIVIENPVFKKLAEG
jgi:hypothetical protein